MADSIILYTFGFALILVGIAIFMVAAILISARNTKKGNAKAAGVIIVGLVPIIFGSDKKDVKTILALSISLTAILIAAFLIYYFLVGR